MRTVFLFFTTYRKRGCLLLPVCCLRLSTALENNRQRNTHAGVYRCTVKCAYESNTYPRSTLRSLIYTPRGNYLCICLCLQWESANFDCPKTKRDNAFKYVVLRPAARLFYKSFLACRADSICKSTNFARNKKISLELFANIGNYAYLCSVRNDYPVNFLRSNA